MPAEWRHTACRRRGSRSHAYGRREEAVLWLCLCELLHEKRSWSCFLRWLVRFTGVVLKHLITWPAAMLWNLPTNHIGLIQNNICQLSPLAYQLSLVSCHLSPVICHLQLSPASCHLSAVSYLLSAVTCYLEVVTCYLPDFTCQLSAITCQLSAITWYVRWFCMCCAETVEQKRIWPQPMFTFKIHSEKLLL